MKKKYLLFQLLLVLFAIEVNAGPNDFITLWDLSKTGGGVNNQISFNATITSTGTTYSWETVPSGSSGGPVAISTSGLVTITGLPTSAIIRLTIVNTNFRSFRINDGTDKARLTDVSQWGTTAWNNLANAFYGCINLNITATDIPALGNVSSMVGMFRDCAVLNGPANIGSWTTTNVTNMSGMFRGATVFNQNIGTVTWNTANVTNMSTMFRDALAFNQDIGGWSTTKVTDMSEMFRGAIAFNQNIGTLSWNTSAVLNMSAMFRNASAFDQDIGDWNTSAVTNMESMFRSALKFNGDIGGWTTSSVTTMANMFDAAVTFNQDLDWTTGSVTTMANMFYGAAVFNGDITNWDTEMVTDMTFMFRGASAFNQDIGGWETGSVTNMSGMFREAVLFNQDIGGWDTGEVTNMSGMFYTASRFNQNGQAMGWSTEKVADMSEMFRSAIAFNTNIGGWTTDAVTDMTNMFRNATVFNQNIGGWNTALVTSMVEMFRNADAFNQDIHSWNTAAVTNMSFMFYDADVFNQNLGAWTLNANVNLADMLSGSGLDCAHYSATLMGWADNVNTPTNRVLGASELTFGTNAVDERTILDDTKGWTITDAGSSGTICILSSFPVTLVSFSAKELEGRAALQWQTTSEIGASHFEIEKSSNARTFEKVGRVDAAGNSNSVQNYTFSDDLKGDQTSVVYYRLRSVDLDETFSLSRVIALQRRKETLSLGVYPNPVQKSGKVTVETNAPELRARLMDLLGRQTQLPTTLLRNGKAEFDLAGVKSGLYIMQLHSASGTVSTKLVIN